MLKRALKICLIMFSLSLILLSSAAASYPSIRSEEIKKKFSISNRVYPTYLLWPVKDQKPVLNRGHGYGVGWRDAKRIHDAQGGTWASWIHKGIDIPTGGKRLPVLAVQSGKAYAGYKKYMGNYVIIDHGNGWYTKYQHLDRFAGKIYKGCSGVNVSVGDNIGYVGNTGGSYPIHLHFEIVWSPRGAGHAKEYNSEIAKKKIVAYSPDQKKNVTHWWADTWEICTGDKQKWTTDKNDPRLFPYQTTDNGNYYCRTTTNVSCYSSPDEKTTVVKTIPSGYGVFIQGRYNSWLKTKDNLWIKDNQVTELKEYNTQRSSESESYKSFTTIVTPIYDIVYLEAEPYSTYNNENDHKGMIPVRKNERLTVKNVWQNKYGNYWLELADEAYKGYFICANNVKEFACAESNDVWIDGLVFPENDLKLGKGFDIKGTVKSSYEINEITGGVYLPFWPYPKVDNQFEKTLTYKSPIKSLNLYTSNINVASRGGISFGKLSKGVYTFRLTVKYNKLLWHDVTNAADSPITSESQTKVFSSNFTIGMGKDSETALGDIVDEIQVTGITLNSTSKTMRIGEILSLKETIQPDNATNPKVSWSSSDPSVAEVENGKVTAKNKGTATITVTAEDGSKKTATCTVSVQKLPESISVEGGHDLYLNDNNNKTLQLTATVLPDDASDTEVTWTSSDDRIAEVSSTGEVTAKDIGHVTITATANGNTNLLDQSMIEVKNYVVGLSITGKEAIAVGSNAQYKVTFNPSTGIDQNIVWTTSDASIATVDSDGIVHGVRQGTITLTATSTDRNTVSTGKEISVYQPIKEISISGTHKLTTGNSTALIANAIPSNVNIDRITWSSNKPSVATVNQNGVVTAVGNGVVAITATASDDSTVYATHEIEVTTLISSLEITEIDSVDVGSSINSEVSIFPSSASNKMLVWSVDNETIASVDNNGIITGLAPGPVTVTATTTDGSGISTSVNLEVIQRVEHISVDIPTVAYVGDVIDLNAIVFPDNVSNPQVVWASSNEGIVLIEELSTEERYADFDSYYAAKCINEGTVRLMATAIDGSGISGYAYVVVHSSSEIQRHTLTYDLLTTGNSNDKLGQVSLTADCASRAAEAGCGAVWSIEHVSGNNASLIGINEQNKSYDGFILANAVSINLLRINQTGSDIYRVSCTINGNTDFCLVTINVAEPENPLPESVTLNENTFYGTVGENISVSTISTCLPVGSGFPSTVRKQLYGMNAFNRYSEVIKDGDSFLVKFTKAGTYTAKIQFQGANYQYDVPISFIITDPNGTVPAEIENLSFDDSVLYLLTGETNQLIVNIQPSDADENALTWSSSDNTVVSVDQSGIVTAVGQGSAIITVSSDNGISTTALVYVSDTLLSIDWNAENTIRVFVDGNAKTTIQKIYLTPKASSSLTESPVWSLKRIQGDNLTLMQNPIVITEDNGTTTYGCEIILKSVSAVGTTEYELTCSDGIHSAATTIRVTAENSYDILPSLISWQNSTFTGNVNHLITIYPIVTCWPEDTSLPDVVTVSFEGDSYWNAVINQSDYTVSRDMMTFSFSEPGVYTANCIYSCSNMKYLVPVTFRIKDSNGTVPVRVSNLTLNTDEISIETGNTFQMNAFITPEDATEKGITWSVEDSSIATISNSGLITAISNGRTTVWCTPSDDSCNPVKCIIVVEDIFTITQTEEMSYQYLQGEIGNAVAGFSLSKGTAKRIKAEGVTPTWNLTRVSGNAADVTLQENNGIMYIAVTALNRGGTDIYEVTCQAGTHTWTGRATFEVEDLGKNAPTSVSIATTNYTADVNEEIELDFTPVCQPASASIPTELRSSYVGIGDFYQGLVDSYRTSVLTARNDTIKVAFKRPGTYVLSRSYRSCNLNYVTECTISVGSGNLNLLKCTDLEPVVYIGGKSSIATTCILSDISIEELYGTELVWNAERLSGDCLTVALRADQSSASLYVVNAKETGSERWRVSCTFQNITAYMDVTIHAVEPRTLLPESVSLYQTEFDGMIGKNINVPLAVTCAPIGTSLPETSAASWAFITDGFGTDHASWTFDNENMRILFSESGYYGGRLVYESGNVRYEFPISFAIVDEESLQNTPSHLDLSLDHSIINVYPEGDLGVNIVKAVLSDSLDEYSLSSIAAYADRVGAVWSIEITSGNACVLSINQVNTASVQIKLSSISGYGDVTYNLNCAIAGTTYTATGIVHVASSNEPRPQPRLLKNYFTTHVGTSLAIDASFYDRTTNAKLCSGRDSVWENDTALAAMGFSYGISGDSWLPVFYEEGSYVTTVSAWIGNLEYEEELLVCVYNERPLPINPSVISIPNALETIEEEAFCQIPVNIIDLRGGEVRTIGTRAFAECSGLIKAYIPGSVTFIAEDAFDGCKGFVIYCVEGSTADIWARQHGIPALYENN